MRVSRMPLGVIVLGVVVAGGLYLGFPNPRRAAATQQLAAAIQELTELTKPATDFAAGVLQNPKASAPTVAAKEVFAPGTKTILLSEPVVILGGNAQPIEALPKGAQVALLGHFGEYSQVRYQNRVITVPRTSVVAGAYVSK